MSHNKGKYYRKCLECNRKRYISYRSLNTNYGEGTCSKGHKWVYKIGIPSQIVALEIDRIAKVLPSIFERDDTFYKTMRKK